jgi:pimeloyl-ACP methyl ester carboxylesterase
MPGKAQEMCIKKHLFFLSAICLFFVCRISASFEIGHVAITFQDPDRNNRNVLTEIYYPSDVAGEDVPVAEPPAEGFPVVVFGHGYMMPWDVYQHIWAALVPEGYIVALPRTEGNLFPSHLAFGKDLAFLVSRLQAEGADPASNFYQKVGMTSAVMGHSMGGGAGFLAVTENPSITTLVTLAAAETTPSAIEAAQNLTLPALLFAGSDDCVTPPGDHQIPMYEALGSGCKILLNITGASHCQFAAYSFTCSLGEIGCSTGIGRSEQHALVHFFLVPWCEYMLKGTAAEWLVFEDRLNSGEGFTFLRDCSGIPPVDIALIPAQSPLVVPAGDYFTFTGVLANQTDEGRTVDVWLMVRLPGGAMYGPVKQYMNIPLAPYKTITVPGIIQDIPRFAPRGTYDYFAYAGTYPTGIIDLSSFEFTVVDP